MARFRSWPDTESQDLLVAEWPAQRRINKQFELEQNIVIVTQ